MDKRYQEAKKCRFFDDVDGRGRFFNSLDQYKCQKDTRILRIERIIEFEKNYNDRNYISRELQLKSPNKQEIRENHCHIEKKH